MAGIALGVSAAALWALDVPGLAYRDPARPQLPGDAQARLPEAEEPRFDRERTSDIALRLDLGVKKAPPPAKAEAPEKPAPAPAASQTSGPVVTYIGPIYEGTRTLAVVSIDGRQRIVPEGRSIGGTRILSIAENQIELQDEEGGRRSIARGERSGTAVSWLRPSAGGAQFAANMPGGQNIGRRTAGVPTANMQGGRGQASGFSPEMEQRFRERGIDPAQAQRWRETLRQRENQNPAQQARVVQAIADGSVLKDAEGNVTIVPKEDADNSGWVITETVENGDEIITRIKRLREDGQIGEDGEIYP
jgi:hypothetical protein